MRRTTAFAPLLAAAFVLSIEFARDVVYRVIPPAGDPPAIDEDYIAKVRPVVDEQIQKAGVRLAAALNLAFQ